MIRQVTPVTTNDGRVIGAIVRNEVGSYFVQRKFVTPRDACVNYGINAPYMLRDGIPAKL